MLLLVATVLSAVRVDAREPFVADPAFFAPPRAEFAPNIEPLSSWGGFRVHKVIYPSVNPRYEPIVAYLTRPSLDRPAPTVLILPITDGDYFTKGFGNFLAERGFASLRFRSRADLMRVRNSGLGGIEEFRDRTRTYVVDIRRAVGWLMTQPGIAPNRIGVMGISHGAIIGSLLMEIDPRMKAGVFLLGGGGLAEILLSSKEDTIIEIRKKLFEEDGISPETLRREAEASFAPIDPITYGNRVRPERVLLINAYFDQVIRRPHAKALRNAMGRPEQIWLPAGHYTAGLFIGYAHYRTLWHFQKILERRLPPDPDVRPDKAVQLTK